MSAEIQLLAASVSIIYVVSAKKPVHALNSLLDPKGITKRTPKMKSIQVEATDTHPVDRGRKHISKGLEESASEKKDVVKTRFAAIKMKNEIENGTNLSSRNNTRYTSSSGRRKHRFSWVKS